MLIEKFVTGETAIRKWLQEESACELPLQKHWQFDKTHQKKRSGWSFLKRKAKVIAEMPVLTIKSACVLELL